MKFTSSLKLSLFSPLDYTLALTELGGGGLLMTIFRPRTVSHTIEWYRILYRTLFLNSVKSIPTTCNVFVPELDVRVFIPLEDKDQAYQLTTDYLRKEVMKSLEGIEEWEDVLKGWVIKGELEFCWKRFDRLEWVYLKSNPDGSDRIDWVVTPEFVEGVSVRQYYFE